MSAGQIAIIVYGAATVVALLLIASIDPKFWDWF